MEESHPAFMAVHDELLMRRLHEQR